MKPRKPKSAQRNAGRPAEGRVKMTLHVLPCTARAIAALVDKTTPAKNTQGKIIDARF